MSTVKRTPPKKKQTDNPRQIHTSSESDISSAALTSDLVKMNRNKRPRSADSPQGGSTLDFQNLQNTLSSWREEQDSKLATILADIVEIKTQNTHIKESNDEIRKTNEELKVSISFINKQFEDLKKEVEELKRERQDQQRNIENLERTQNVAIPSQRLLVKWPKLLVYRFRTMRSVTYIGCRVGPPTLTPHVL
ncbi:unnamed protein product [Arctia plantaginis]|uniref:Uncharacterized protein n=1 Tax=Arctia plantaginis TaxID=874455 RepID=A0A8S1AW14_ARCPL|nr:unnamed protein product [Arctia plantaginis]